MIVNLADSESDFLLALGDYFIAIKELKNVVNK
jgi:hypothetical protein